MYAIYQLLMEETKRYELCNLAKLGSHTASDKTSKSAGDIEIMKNGIRYEAIEVKLDKSIDANMLRIAIEKIYQFNLMRYYIFSHIGVKQEEQTEIEQLINRTKKNHGCQIIINGVLPTIKYYLRLVDDTKKFVITYSKLVEEDPELKRAHKLTWNTLIENILNK